MSITTSSLGQQVIDILNSGGVAVVRTDTIYGIVASASNREAVNRVYEIKRRSSTKSPIVLISSGGDIFDDYDPSVFEKFSDYWPGKNSIILPSQVGPSWLTRGSDSIAYRLPDSQELIRLLQKTGPLIAPSANPQGMPPAMDVAMAISYFGSKVDIYVDGGQVEDTAPSRLFRLTDDGVERLR